MFFRAVILIAFCSTIQSYSQDVKVLNIVKQDVSVNKVDSLNDFNRQSFGLVSAFENYGESKIDSVNPQKKFKDYSAKLDALKSKLTSRVDSLTAFSNRDSLTSRDLNRLKSKLDSINSLCPPKSVGEAQESVEALEQKVSGKIDSIESKINKKLRPFSENGGNMPGAINLPGANLKTSLNIDPNLSIDPNLAVPEFNLPSIENPLGNINSPNLDIGSNIPGEIPSLPNVEMKEIKALQDVSKVQDRVAGINEGSEQIKGYQEDLKKLQEGDVSKIEGLPDAIESKVENLDEIKSLEEAFKEFAAIKAQWNDPEVLKEQALNKAKETAINHFAGHEKELKAAIDKLSKLKAKIPDPEGAIDLFAKRQQFMKGKPIVERIVPGFAFQFQKQVSFWLDLNPYVGFKISGRWLAGLGWNERVAFNFVERSWDKENRIYGFRGFVNFKLRENFWLKGDIENMNSPVRTSPLMTSEIVGKKWIWSYFAGIKKDFQFSKNFKGNVQTLYNVYNPDKRSPYIARLNIRIGFELPLSKKAGP